MSESRSRTLYRELMAARPELFTSERGGIRIVTTDDEIRHIERLRGQQLAAAGMPESWAETGVHYEDPFIQVLRDAVVFPDGSPGIHHRIVRRDGRHNPTGVAILCRHAGKLVLVRHYRHAVGGWQLEIPRGGVARDQSPEDAVRMELSEEIGGQADSVRRIGQVHGNSALMRGHVDLYFADLSTVGSPAIGEGITKIYALDVAKFESHLRDDAIKDAFTQIAFFRARQLHLI